MSFTKLYFEFDNRKSDEFPIYIVRINSGMFSTEFGGSKQMKYDKIAYNDDIYYYSTELDNLKFSIVVSPLDGLWTEDMKFELFRWLGSRQPKAFRTTDFMGKLCYCICTNALILTTTGTQQGYMELEFEATTPYWLTDPIIVEDDLTDKDIPYTFILKNNSNIRDPKTNEFYYYPIMEFDLVGDSTSITLTNLSNGGRVTSLTSLSTGEYIKIDNKLKYIDSSTGNYRLNNFNKNWFMLNYGVNYIKISEKCKFRFTMQFPIYI